MNIQGGYFTSLSNIYIDDRSIATKTLFLIADIPVSADNCTMKILFLVFAHSFITGQPYMHAYNS